MVDSQGLRKVHTSEINLAARSGSAVRHRIASATPSNDKMACEAIASQAILFFYAD